jgi:multisubunit Na+/H+ antiporter MnhF subunit
MIATSVTCFPDLPVHPVLLSAATIWLATLLGILLVFAIVIRSALTRILALDTLTLVLIAFLALAAARDRSGYALDAALVVALLAFVGTIAAARYYSRGSLFR